MKHYILQEKDYENDNPSNAVHVFRAESDAEAVRIAAATFPDWRDWAVLKRVDLVEVKP